jgi:hypothetical protein
MRRKTMTNRMTLSEMAVPKPRGEIIGAYVLTTAIVFFVVVGVSNLLNRIALIPSIIWLVLVATVVWGRCRKEGIGKFLTNVQGRFASKHFVEKISEEKVRTEIRFGYQLFGRRYFYLRLPIDKIETVEWRSGQATDMVGRDMNDWHVVLWFDHDDPAKRDKWSRKPDQDIYIVGPDRRKEDTEAFGLSLVDFLRNAGALLAQGEDNCSFVRPTP